MKLIVAGSRFYSNYPEAEQRLLFYLQNTDEVVEIVSGVCDKGELTFTRPDGTQVFGADGLGERFAEEMGLPVKSFPPDKKKYGDKKAYYFRNKDMAIYCTHAIVFYDGVSKGSAMMLRLLEQFGKKQTTRKIKI